jgi:hypothetical protein
MYMMEIKINITDVFLEAKNYMLLSEFVKNPA